MRITDIVRKKYIYPVYFFLFLLLVPGTAFARLHVVRSSGESPILQNDVSQAKDEAITDAEIKAVERVVGVMVDSRTVVEQTLMIDSTVKTHVSGFVKSYKILSGGENKSGDLYKVDIEASVDDKPLEDSLTRLMMKDKVIVLSYESGIPSGGAQDLLADTIISKLTALGYKHIIDYRLYKNRRVDALIRRLRRGDQTAARLIGIYYLANVVILGQVNVRRGEKQFAGMYSAHASGSARAFNAAHDKLIADVVVSSGKGFGSDENAALQDAFRKASKTLSDRLVYELTPKQRRTIKVVFYNIPTFEDFKRYKNLLSQLRWVEDVREDQFGYNEAKTVFIIHYTENPEYLASRLSLENLKVLKFNDTEIKVNAGK